MRNVCGHFCVYLQVAQACRQRPTNMMAFVGDLQAPRLGFTSAEGLEYCNRNNNLHTYLCSADGISFHLESYSTRILS